MPGGKSGAKQKSRHVKAKKQKKRFMRAKDPIQAVFMWGIHHSINEIMSQPEPSLLLEEDFKAFSKIRVENQYYNKEYLPGHFKFKEYCPFVFHDLRKRFRIDDTDYMNSLSRHHLTPIDSPGRSGANFFLTSDKMFVIKSLSSEEVALLHQILQPYHAHIVTNDGYTLLPQYMGMYRLTVNNAETYWIVMRNIFSSQVKVHLKFDLKGSTVDRAASDKEKAKTSPTLKDNDFTQMEAKIIIGDEAKTVFLSKLESDVALLQSLNLMDYSLLVGINDCTLPQSDSEDEDDDDELGASGDELQDEPNSPTSPVIIAEVGESEGFSLEPETLVTTEEVETTGTSPSKGESTPSPDEVIEKSGSSPPGATPITYRPAVVSGEKAVEIAKTDGYFPVIDKEIDVFAIPSTTETKPQIYFMAIIDVLTNYGSRKRAAHAAKTMKHGQGAEISTVKPEQYARRFLEFMQRSIK